MTRPAAKPAPRGAAPRSRVEPPRHAQPPGAAIEAHIRGAIEHAHAGRTADALREARAALFHDPRNLYSRMLLGRQLIEVDAPRGRQMLRDLLESAALLPSDAEVPCADGLSVGQLTAAVRILLDRPEAE